MALKDVVTKDYMQLKDVFADVFNFFLYDGKPVIQPHQLQERSTEIFDIRKLPTGKKQSIQKFRDLLCLLAMDDPQYSYILLGIENQTQVHYAMPVRNMLYDALQYRDQIKLITKQHRLEHQKALKNQQEKKDSESPTGASSSSPAEFLSGFCKEDRLHPVITLVVYFGADPWDGPRCIHDMFTDTPQELLTFIPNYKLHLIEPAALSDEELAKFQTNLREVLTCIKYSKDKERLNAVMHTPRFNAVQYEAATLLNELADLKLDFTAKEKGGTVNMCIGFDQIKEDCKRQGRTEGHAAGCLETSLANVQSIMINLNLDPEKAMDALNIAPEHREFILQKINQTA